tara:strand:- start:259 stop:504 length:246 start_codon:yes stop_codon:yes gene_type:complete
MKPGDLVLNKATIGSRENSLPPELTKIGIVMSTQKIVDKRPLDLQLKDPYPKETKLVTVMFSETRYTHCFPEYYLELISEA